MSELGGLLVLVLGLGALTATGALAACCLRPRSFLELLLGAYVVAWAWLVALLLALSPVGLVRRETLVAGLLLGAVASAVAWQRLGRPRPPARSGLRAVLRRPAVLALAFAVGTGAAYSASLAFLVPANEADALAYHLPRAAFWKQEGAVGYIENAPDLRLNVSPPNAEIGQLATMLLSGTDRFVALPQLAAYAALLACVAALAGRLALSPSEAAFAALAFATLPVVALQASTALNDLVVAAFLAIAALFALTPGRGPLLLASLALALALGTKFTAVLALPALALVVVVGRRRADLPALALGAAAGAVLGSLWYLLNLSKSGELDGGLAAEAKQRVAPALSDVTVNTLRYALDVLDLSGLASPYSVVLWLCAAVVAASVLVSSGAHRGRTLLAGFLLTLAPLAVPRLSELGERATLRGWRELGRPETAPFDRGWGVNELADPTLSWFGPLALVVLIAATVAVARRGTLGLPRSSLALVAAPFVLLLTLGALVAWDPWRGRFLVFGVALAASSWGLLLRSPAAARATVGVGVAALALSLATYLGKPSGFGEVWPPREDSLALDPVWGDPRPVVQTRLRPDGGELPVYEYFEDHVPEHANVALALRENDFISPYFGRRLTRHVELIPASRRVPQEAEWLVLAPQVEARRCRGAWHRELTHVTGWRVEHRSGRGSCRPRDVAP